MTTFGEKYDKLKTMNEKELREYKVPYVETQEELDYIIKILAEREQDYGTCVYSASISAVATFNYFAHVLGMTGFQAGCADLDIISRTRGMEKGFTIVNYENLLYPQYFDSPDKFPTAEYLLEKNIKHIGLEATSLIRKNGSSGLGAHPDVLAHWKKISDKARKIAETDQEYAKEFALADL